MSSEIPAPTEPTTTDAAADTSTASAPVARPKSTGLHVGDAKPGVAKVDPIIVVDGVRRTFGGLTAVDVEHLEIPRGVITALIGPNGAGKTTLFNLLTGFDKPNEGAWTFDGRSISGVPAFKMARMGQVRTFQLTKALGLLTVLDNMKLGAKGQRGERFWQSLIPAAWRGQDTQIEKRAMELLAKFKLDTKAPDFAASLSGGQRKLLEMARALMSEPKLVMLDEPMAGVNPALTQSLLDHILDLKDEGMTVLFVEHDMHMVRHIADWVVVMAEGRVVAEGDPYTVMQDPAVIDAYLGAHQELDLGVVTGRVTAEEADPTTDASASVSVDAEDLANAGIAEAEAEFGADSKEKDQ
ncbi:amino acid/amide ABC transporter ATP-binding protein 1, HAAT family [Agromyces sp. CF514]|nr:amino acid/amide ABC transporter ATP-binding protein 1, HAAT family [Agromyces sp. CF514]